MSKQLKGVGVWLIVLVLMIAGLSYLGEKLQTQNNYSYKELEEDLENHRVAEAVIHQNQQTPTGQLIAVLMNGRSKDMYIDDVKEVRQMLEDANVSYQMTDVPKESKLLSVGVPIASLGVMVILLFMLMGRNAGSGGGGSKMMNFGKSRAQLTQPSGKRFTFRDVAGLQEEKEDLKEIVDFLKNPKKYTDVLGTSVKGRLNTLVHNVIINSVDRPVIQMSEEVHEAMQGLRVFMFENVYRNPVAKKEEGKAIHMITNLYEFYIKNPEFLPEQSQNMLKKGEELSRVVCDYIAGMTDQYALAKYSEYFMPKSWQVY